MASNERKNARKEKLEKKNKKRERFCGYSL